MQKTNGLGGNASNWFALFKSNLSFDKGHDFYFFYIILSAT